MAAPIVLAKGYHEVAQRIKAIAADHNITMVENIALARTLAEEVGIGKPVPTKVIPGRGRSAGDGVPLEKGGMKSATSWRF